MVLYFFVLILVTFYVLSYIIETSHLEDLEKREMFYKDKVVVNNLKRLPSDLKVKEAFLCSGNVVIGANYYNRFSASLKQIIGGHLKGLEKIVERAYREAFLRMIEEAYKRGANMVVNVRLETSCLGRTDRKGETRASMLEVLVYGTAVRTS
jgi:uncharacterized protein YbjQ (UPF0145 family)